MDAGLATTRETKVGHTTRAGECTCVVFMLGGFVFVFVSVFVFVLHGVLVGWEAAFCGQSAADMSGHPCGRRSRNAPLR